MLPLSIIWNILSSDFYENQTRLVYTKADCWKYEEDAFMSGLAICSRRVILNMLDDVEVYFISIK